MLVSVCFHAILTILNKALSHTKPCHTMVLLDSGLPEWNVWVVKMGAKWQDISGLGCTPCAVEIGVKHLRKACFPLQHWKAHF